jgi:hypothetical protein
LVTPTISPRWASFLKQSRHMLNFLKNPLERPHNGQRLYLRVPNFGSSVALILKHFFAIVSPLLFFAVRHSE